MNDEPGDAAVDPTSLSRTAFRAWAAREMDAASLLIGVDRSDEAHRRFIKIARFFSPDDPSAEAALLWQHLGGTWRDCTLGLKNENLLHSKEMFERARTHPERRADPYRLALTRDQLAVTLRQLMAFASDEGKASLARRAEKLFTAALAFFEGAIPRARKAVRLGLLPDHCGTRINFGNLLGDIGRLEEARRHYERALRDLESARPQPPKAAAQVPQLQLNLALLLSRRGHPDDRERIARLLMAVRRSNVPHLASQAAIRLAQLAEATGDTAAARQLLGGIEPGHLPPDAEAGFIAHLARLGGHSRALEMASVFMHAAARRRTPTLSSAYADLEGQRLQLLSAVVARIHVEHGDAIDAFLALEEHAALRFDETLRRHWLPHRDRISVELMALSTVADNCAISLEEFAGHVAILGRSGSHDIAMMFDDLITHLQTVGGPVVVAHAQDIRRRAIESARAAQGASDPVAALLDAARTFATEGARLQALTFSHDPDLEAAYWSTGIQRPTLARLASARPDEFFIRLSVTTDLLAVAVWFDGHDLKSRHLRCPLPDDYHAIVSALHDDITSASDGRAAALFEALDLSPVFPPRRGGTAVLLPSRLAAVLPLAAIGPAGRTPLDHFDAIRQMPNLRPLITPFPPRGQRRGRVALVGPGTVGGSRAFTPCLPGETRLAGDDATVDRLREVLGTAEIVSIYAHGHHRWGQRPALDLAGVMVPSRAHPLLENWAGIERVELWACRSGSNATDDPRSSPFVDEVTGLDGFFLESGARCTLGVLYPVREMVAVEVARVYREGLAGGDRPDRALADALRWWRDHLPPLSTADLAQHDDPDAPADAKDRGQALRCPSAWAIFRVMGVCDPSTNDPEANPRTTPLTHEDEAHIDALIARAPDPPRGMPGTNEAAEQFEQDLAAATAEALTRPTDPDTALALADLLRGRLHADHRHNLVRALAWLSDALAAPSLARDDRVRLQVRSVHLWLDLTAEYVLHWCFIRTSIALWPILHRIDTLLAQIPASAARGARAIRAAMAMPEPPIECNSDVERVIALLDDVATLPIDDLIRAAEVALWLADAAPTLGTRIIVAAKVHFSGRATSRIAQACRAHRLGLAIRGLAHRLGASAHAPGIMHGWLTPPERLRAVNELSHALAADFGAQGRPVADGHHQLLMQELDDLVWGGMGEYDPQRWRGTGGHGCAWWQATNNMVRVALRNEHDPRKSAPHLIAALHLGADLRTQQHHRWSRFTTAWAERYDDPLAREVVLDLLTDASYGPDRPTDIFSQDIEAIRANASEPTDQVAWLAANFAGCFDEAGIGPARTVAGRLARAASAVDAFAEKSWPPMLEAECVVRERHGIESRPFSAASAPEQDIDALQRGLLLAPPEVAHLALGRLLDGRVFVALAHRDQCRLEAFQETPDFVDLLSVFCTAGTPVPGLPSMPAMVEAWHRITGCVAIWAAPALKAVLGAGARHLRVLSPGPLRMIPWLGLPIEGRPLAGWLAAREGSLTHLPALGWRAPPVQQGLDGCLGPDDDPLMATVLSGLRAHEMTRTLDPFGGTRSGWSELDRLAHDDVPVARLRLTGQGDAVAGIGYMARLRMATGAPITARDIERLTFSPGAEVELWGCVDHRAPSEWEVAARDRLPGPVRAALRRGAGGVLDLAWPIDPLVRALLCERFGLLTRCGGLGGARALTLAVADVDRWLGEALADVQAIAPWRVIDQHRKEKWRRAGSDLGAFPSLANCGVALDADRLRARYAFDLGAVRWWGSDDA